MAIELAASIPEKRKANKAEAAEWFGVSIPSIDGWLRRGCPYVQRGERGKQWVLDLHDMARWRFAGSDDQPEEDPEKLDPKARLDWYRGSTERDKWLERRKELVQVSDYERELGAVLKRVAMALETLPDVVERETGLPGAAIEVVQGVADRLREEIYQRVISDT